MISADSLRKQYGDLVAVDGITFSVKRGELIGLLGPNGAGKSTTINMIVGVLAPDSGEINIDSSGAPTQASVRLRIGNAPQSLALYDELTAEENLRFFGRLYNLGGTALHQRVAWALELAGLTDRRKHRVSTFSGGMKRRLNLVCALVHDPPLLLLDEPTVGVDPQSRNLIFEQIESMRKDGRTIVYTTHYMEEAQRLCDRVAIIDHGRILDLDTVDNLINRHGGSAVVEIEFERVLPADIQLPAQPDGCHLRFESSRPLEDVARLSSQGLSFRTLHVERPDLESVFLNLTGRRLRD